VPTDSWGSSRALLARINRLIAGRAQVRKTRPGSVDRANLGEYYMVHLPSQAVVRPRLHLSEYAAEIRVRIPYQHRRDRAAARRYRDADEDEPHTAADAVQEWLDREIIVGGIDGEARRLIERLIDDLT
jgi:hypothetical protein